MANTLAIDWGTTHLRVWLLDTEGQVLAQRQSDRGMGKLAPHEFEPALLDLVDDWLAADQVIQATACGMVGARQGWIEADYAELPYRPAQGNATNAPCADPRLAVQILPGLCQRQPHADVMRGEETQIAGYLASDTNFSGVICLPGTHTKWVRIDNGVIRQFQTVMTGELFALLSQQSVLRHSVNSDDWDAAAFSTALTAALAEPARVVAQLFQLRAADLLEGQAAASAKARLSGLLIGLELAGTRAYWQQQAVVLIGDESLCQRYVEGLATQGITAQHHDATAMTLAGLRAASR